MITRTNSVQVGKLAPEFEVTAVFDEKFRKIRFSDYRKKNMLFYFFIHQILLLFVLPK